MSNQLQELQQSLVLWAKQAEQLGWLTTQSSEKLTHLSTSTPGDLFSGDNRPLVAALFGGTGVGKSTLLNRLAGDEIARASAARPTSTNITAYVHSSITVDNLPDEFPMQRMQTAIHQNNRYQSVLWLDMPDFDSVESTHRDLVTQWLPHIDLLVYVVSPERYKDDQGWRLLLEHGSKHAWVFVFNHWDKGDERQRADFTQLLENAGFEKPHVFCTDSSDNQRESTDEFAGLEAIIGTIADEQLVQQLDRRGIIKRLELLAHQANEMQLQLGSEDQLALCESQWEQKWNHASSELMQVSQWKAQSLAETFPEQDTRLLSVLPWFKQPSKAEPAKTEDPAIITDDLFFSHTNGALEAFIQQANATGLPYSALHRHLAPLKAHWQESLPSTINTALAQSMALPGERWQRAVYRLFGILATVLPLAALAWVAYRVVNTFQTSGANPESYLGSNFAVHSAMLVSVAWFIPWFAQRRTRPSRQAAALRGIQSGLQACSQKIDIDCRAALDNLAAERMQLKAELADIVSGQGRFDDAKLPAALQRMLMKPSISQGT
jgi:hypothetical protein